jgi:hypothetical protein
MKPRHFGRIAVLVPAAAVSLCLAAPAAAPPRVVHVIVALADNRTQGIVPVPAAIGNGDDPGRNLYWGGAYGIRTFFKKSTEWQIVAPCAPGKEPVLERCVFRHRRENAYLVADAYRGREIRSAVADFFTFSAGRRGDSVKIGDSQSIPAAGAAAMVVYVGHDGLMDFALDRYQYWADDRRREVMILACASKSYFADALRRTGAQPLLWTTGLLAPEGYILEAALAGWTRGETGEQIRTRAAEAYNKYQHCGPKAANRLFATGW